MDPRIAERLAVVLDHIVNDYEEEAVRVLDKNIDIIDEEISIECATLNNHCVCATNVEYFLKSDHVIQRLRAGKCFHYLKYHSMDDKQHDTVRARTKLILIAAALGKFEIFKLLHSNGCCLETKSGIFELRPLHLAINNGHFNIFCYLLGQQVDFNAIISSYGTTFSPLMMAVKNRQFNMVRHLLMVRGINIYYRNSLFQSPVLFAVQNNDIDLADLLLRSEQVISNTPQVNQLGGHDNLHHACAILEALKQDNTDVLRVLRRCGCDMNFVFRGYHAKTTAVNLAVLQDSHKCLSLLVDWGASVDVECLGFTAIDWALNLSCSECMTILQESRFKRLISALDNDNESGDNLALDNDNESGDNFKTYADIHTASENNENRNGRTTDLDRQVVKEQMHNRNPLISIWGMMQWLDVSDIIIRLVANGYNIDTQDRYGRTCLHMAVEEQSVTGVRTLLKLGANAEIRDICNASPFWHAVYWNKESMIKELMFANVFVECSAFENAHRLGPSWTDLHSAEQTQSKYRSTLYISVKKNFWRTVSLLLEAGYCGRGEDIEYLISIAAHDTKDILMQHYSQPNSLFCLTRNFIRRQCGRKIHELVKTVELPFRVRDCLLLRDIMDLKVEPVYV